MEGGEPGPPLFRSWKAWYGVVLGTLALEIVLFVVFTRALS